MHIAVIGASNNATKYGYRIVRYLKETGHTVYPVNPKEQVILGLPCFPDFTAIPSVIDIIDIVVPPPITLAILKTIAARGVYNVWIQPGAEDETVISYLDENRKSFGRITYHDCIMTSLDRHYPNR